MPWVQLGVFSLKEDLGWFVEFVVKMYRYSYLRQLEWSCVPVASLAGLLVSLALVFE